MGDPALGESLGIEFDSAGAATLSFESSVVDRNGNEVICPQIHHVGVSTPRLAEVLQWYRDVLGQQPTLAGVPPAHPYPGVWTSNDETHHRMAITSPPNMVREIAKTAPSVSHVAWEYESLDDLLATWVRLTKLDIHPHLAVNHGVSFALYYFDPDGQMVELLADPYGVPGRSREAMLTSEDIRTNPYGATFDPQKLIDAREAGMSLDDVHAKSYAGEFAPDDPDAYSPARYRRERLGLEE